MILYVCAVFDRASEAFTRPFYVSRPGEAIRHFSDEVQRKPEQAQGNPLHAHPSDFELHQLAIFDDNTGVFENRRERLARAEDFHFGRDGTPEQSAALARRFPGPDQAFASNTESGGLPTSKF